MKQALLCPPLTHTPEKATSYFMSHSLFTLLPSALTVKPEDSSQSPLGRGREDLARHDINKRALECWHPHCLESLKVENILFADLQS